MVTLALSWAGLGDQIVVGGWGGVGADSIQPQGVGGSWVAGFQSGDWKNTNNFFLLFNA